MSEGLPHVAGVPIIDRNAVFTMASLREALGLRTGSLPREIRQKRLKAHKRCRKYFILGVDVLAWIEGGEAKHRGAELSVVGNGEMKG